MRLRTPFIAAGIVAALALTGCTGSNGSESA